MPLLFAVTLFISASLLFMIQPMVGRMILPLLGGSPGAWNTCMVFFQAVLLLGYLYAHKLTAIMSPRRQVMLHTGVLFAALLVLGGAALLSYNHSPIPIVKSLSPQSTSFPMFGTLALLAVAIGVPFFAVSTSAPLLQRWFAYTGHPASKDPYFLYAASNAGSLISLLGYPLVTEPSLRLVEQAWLFAGGFLLLMVMFFVCGAAVKRPNLYEKMAGKPDLQTPPVKEPEPTLGRKLKWLALSFVPSSLMLGVTFHMTTDIASIPLLWVVPLALYLLTFIIAFAKTPNWFRTALANISPVITLLLVFVLVSQTAIDNTFLSLGLHLTAYFLTALLCHTELARDRPSAAYLTTFYLWISIGGMIGGIFNALIAPIAFPLAWEYPITIAIGCMLIPKLADEKSKLTGEAAKMYEGKQRLFDIFVPIAMLAGVAALTAFWGFDTFTDLCKWISIQSTSLLAFCGLNIMLMPRNVAILIAYALPAMICFLFIDRPVRFGLCVAALLFVGYFRQHDKTIVRTERSFFGILKVEENQYFRKLVHGTTLHGTQSIDPWPYLDELKEPLSAAIGPAGVYGYDLRQKPLTYYHETGPVGHVFRVLRETDPTAHFAMVGLGTGSVSCYARPGQKLTYYEIDPKVKALVADTNKYFTYVTDARERGADVEIVLGDARLKLEEHTDRKYKLLLLDAFSSDAIPIHLLTKEAVELYLDRLTDDGILAVHISNKFVNLEPVVGRIAEKLGLTGLLMNDSWIDETHNHPPGKTQSSWAVLAKNPARLEAFKRPEFGIVYTHKLSAELISEPRLWTPLKPHESVKLWTDDYSDVLSVMMIKEIQRVRHALGLPTMASLRE